MLRSTQTSQVEGELSRQLFTDDYFDLYVWYRNDGSLFGFQLCYDKPGDERALTWASDAGFRHHRVDSGEQEPTDHRSPTLIPGCDIFDHQKVKAEFLERATQIDPGIRKVVLSKLDIFAD